jgi:outer membrane murein-binding lipoprotein Lpp
MLLYIRRFRFSAEPEGAGGGGTPPIVKAQVTEGNPAGAGEDSGDGVKPKPNEHLIPKYRFDEVSKKAKDLEAIVAEMTTKVEQLAEKDARIAQLEKEIKAIKEDTKAEKIKAMKINAIRERVGDKVVDFELFLTLLDMDAISVNKEGKVKGLSAQVQALQKSKPYLWKPAETIVTPGAGSKTKPEKSFAQKLAEQKVAARATADKSKHYFK